MTPAELEEIESCADGYLKAPAGTKLTITAPDFWQGHAHIRALCTALRKAWEQLETKISSIEIKDVIVCRDIDPLDAMNMLSGVPVAERKTIPIIPLFKDQELYTLSNEQLKKMGLAKIEELEKVQS